MNKKNNVRNCSHCKVNITNDSEFLEFNGKHFHPDHQVCIGNLKSQIEGYKILLSEIHHKIVGYATPL